MKTLHYLLTLLTHVHKHHIYLNESHWEKLTFSGGLIHNYCSFVTKTEQITSHNTSLLVDVYTSELGALYTGDPSWFAWHSSTLPTRKRERVVSGFGTLQLDLNLHLNNRNQVTTDPKNQGCFLSFGFRAGRAQMSSLTLEKAGHRCDPRHQRCCRNRQPSRSLSLSPCSSQNCCPLPNLGAPTHPPSSNGWCLLSPLALAGMRLLAWLG